MGGNLGDLHQKWTKRRHWFWLVTSLSRIPIEDFVVWNPHWRLHCSNPHWRLCCLESADRKSIWQRTPHWPLLHGLQFLKDFLLQYFTLVLASVHLRQMTARKYQQFLFCRSLNSKFCNIFFHFQLLAVQDKCAVYMVGDRGAKCIKFL